MYPNRTHSPRVLLIHTGGTIGMQASDKGYVPVPGFETLLREKLESSVHDTLPDFDVLEYEQLIDSANLHPDHWTQILTTLISRYDEYDGFVILHGTDTMAYTASALSFALKGLSKPVLLTGSQIPLTELRNDALDNLITALIIAGFHNVPEVCVYFNGRLLRGNRSRKVKATGLDAFDSPNFPWLGQVGIHIELHNQLIQPAGEPDFKAPTYRPGAVATLPIQPGMPHNQFNAVLDDPEIAAVILLSYGVGNLPDTNQTLMNALGRASKNRKVLLNLSSCLQAQTLHGAYACSAELEAIGVIAGGNITPEAAYSKLHTLLALGETPDTIKALMLQSLCGEMDHFKPST